MSFGICFRHRRNRGSATLVVITLLFLVSALMLSNSRVLRVLHQEMRLIEEKQIRKFSAVAPVNPAAEPTKR